MRFFIDLHDHITAFPYNMGEKNTIGMRYRKNRVFGSMLNSDTQSDMLKIASSGVRVVFASLYPLETGFMKVWGREGELADDGINLYTGFPKSRIDKIQEPGHNYFDDLKKELAFLLRDEGKELVFEESPARCVYKIVNNYTELQAFLGIDQNYEISTSPHAAAKIAIILTIEGAHSLFEKPLEEYGFDFDLPGKEVDDLFEKLKTNISFLKKNDSGKRFFSLTFAHHFYNKLCGQSISFTRFIDGFFKQGNNTNVGFSELGKKVIKELCAAHIIIDVKHMSVPSRQWFYKQDFTQNIPVISSHSAVNGYSTMEQSKENNDDHIQAKKKYKTSTTFNNWDINLSDEEILEISKRKGLIGISLDQRVVMGQSNLCGIRIASKIPWQRNDVWCKPVFQNAMHIANVLYNAGFHIDTIWDNIAIGSDFDGMINPINSVKNATEFAVLEESLKSIFNKNKKNETVLKKYSSSDIEMVVKKIMSINALKFLEKNFT